MKSKKEILELINGNQPIVLHFYTTDCTKHIENRRKLRRLEKNLKDCSLKAVNVLINKQTGLADELDIDGAPAVLLFLGGKEKWRRGGELPEEKIIREVKKLFAVA